ncbi:hypothetical protein B0A52_08331 [Exophiala mesophila]|uniref:Velvet complex subunit laeA n=1 Tax=Exophiala mesophila TaxID=212818 RepID=A0A438MVZ4_EXOME|nr:hypothetical protein B0A52_08331 [Exophiala mesophila]
MSTSPAHQTRLVKSSSSSPDISLSSIPTSMPMAGAFVAGTDTVREYGREYGTFRREQYMMPHDDRERDRLDIMHTMLKVIRPPATRLTSCPTEMLEQPADGPFGTSPRVLDLGCGTGIWMIDMAKLFPQAEFVGVDLQHMGPPSLPPNVSVRAHWDYETIWLLGERSWHLIHLQLSLGSVSDLLGLYQKIHRHLVPRVGWFEHVEIDFQPRCDDGTLQPGRLTEWWNLYIKPVYEEGKRPIHYDEARIRNSFHAAGFIDIQHEEYRLPLRGWTNHPDEQRAKAEQRAGLWWNIAQSSGPQNTSAVGMEAMSLAPLCRYGGGWTEETVRRLCDEALQQASDPNVHAYNVLHIWRGRAP